VSFEAVMLSCTINAKEGRYVAVYQELADMETTMQILLKVEIG